MFSLHQRIKLTALLLVIALPAFATTYLSDSFEYSAWSGMSANGWTFQSIDSSTTGMLSWVTSPVNAGTKALRFAGTAKGVVSKSLGTTNLTNVDATVRVFHNPANNDALDCQFSTFSNDGHSLTLRCSGANRTLAYSVDGGAYVDTTMPFLTGWNTLRVSYDGAGAAFIIINGRLALVQSGMTGLNSLKLGRNWSTGSARNVVFDLAVVETSNLRTISHASIADHANAATSGSIAWNFATYGANQYYVLTSNAAYAINNPLSVPAGATLTQRFASAKVIATPTCDGKEMIILNDWSVLRDLQADAFSKAKHCVVAIGKTGPQIRDCFLHHTKNNFTVDTGRSHIIYFNGCSQVTIDDTDVEYAGYPKAAGAAVNFYGGGIYMQGATGTQNNIRRNTARYTLAAGIDVSGCVNLDVLNNQTYSTGMNYLYPPSTGYADGITGYHHTDGLVRNWNIKGNIVELSYNNGIHVSGKSIFVENNTVSGTQTGNNIVIGDWRSPQEVSSNCTIKNNSLLDCPASGWSSLGVSYYVVGTITVSGNTGCTTIGWQNPQ